MKKIKLFEQFSSPINEAKLPSNVMEWLKRAATSEQEKAAKKVAGWAEKAGGHISGGTSIGKSPQTLILDIKYQGSEIYINADGVIKFEGQEVNTPKEFKQMFEVYKRSSEENKKYFKVQDEPAPVQEAEAAVSNAWAKVGPNWLHNYLKDQKSFDDDGGILSVSHSELDIAILFFVHEGEIRWTWSWGNGSYPEMVAYEIKNKEAASYGITGNTPQEFVANCDKKIGEVESNRKD